MAGKARPDTRQQMEEQVKLFICDTCGDVRRIRSELVTCGCGNTRAYREKDNLTVRINHGGHVIWLNANDIAEGKFEVDHGIKRTPLGSEVLAYLEPRTLSSIKDLEEEA